MLLTRLCTLSLLPSTCISCKPEMFDKWGYHKLGAKQYSEAIEEMRHAETEIKRILFLEGTPIARTEQVTGRVRRSGSCSRPTLNSK